MRTTLMAGSLLLLLTAPLQAETYRWTDGSGTVHFTDKRDEIPPRYRNSAKVAEGAVTVMPASPAVAGTAPAVKPDEVRQDAANSGSHLPAKKSSEKKRKKEKRHREEVAVPKSPARMAQEKAGDQVRKDRQRIEDAQARARDAQGEAEEQVRRAREKTFVH